MNAFVKSMSKRLPDLGIDTGVYTRNRAFCLPASGKDVYREKRIVLDPTSLKPVTLSQANSGWVSNFLINVVNIDQNTHYVVKDKSHHLVEKRSSSAPVAVSRSPSAPPGLGQSSDFGVLALTVSLLKKVL